MMRAKRFVQYFFYTIIGFTAFNFIVWHLFTEKILTRQDSMITGDLTRMGYIPHLIEPRQNRTDLPKLHKEAATYLDEPLDLITIGDSFSQGRGFGLNRYYQDYIATELDWNVLNLMQHVKTRSYMETAVLLANSGFLEKSGVKYLLIESVSRKVVARHSGNVNYDVSMPLQDLQDYYGMGTNDTAKDFEALPPVHFINNGNFKYMAFKLLYHVSDRALFSKTYQVTLSKSLFTAGNGKELLYYNKAIRAIKHHTHENIKVVHENLNRLADFLWSRYRVKLIFMPAVTKYDLYSSFIVDNKQPSDPFFELFRSMENKQYLFIDTKAILFKELEKGEKDIYFCDDTHWTHKASAVIAEELKRLLQP
jgi:hypothetical protein